MKTKKFNDLKSISNYLSGIEDFRVENKCLHKLSDILFIGLLTYLSSGEDYEDTCTTYEVRVWYCLAKPTRRF